MVTAAAPAAARRTGRLDAVARLGGRAALLLLALALAARALYFFQAALALIRWPFEVIVGEGTMLHESRLLNDGVLGGLRALYGPQAPGRFLAGNYPPLYPLLWALKPGPPAFPTGRALALLAGIVVAVAGGGAVYAASRGSRALRGGTALLGAAAVMCTVPALQQIVIAKPDMVALACAALGLAFFEAAPNRRGTVAAGVCFALALLTKQSIGFALAAAALAALRRGPRALLTLALTTGAVLAAVLGGLWLLAGPSLFEHLVLYNLRPWNQQRFEGVNSKFLLLHWQLLVPALGYAAWGLFARPRSALTYYPLTALATMLMVAAEGGGRNYLLELCLAMGLGAALAVGALLAARPAWAPALAVAILGVIALFAVQAFTVFTLGQYVPVPPTDKSDPNPLLALVDATPDPILSDNTGLLAMRHRPVAIDDTFLSELMRERGLWNNAGVIEDIEARRYTLVITRTTEEEALRQQWGDGFVDALLAYYRPSGPNSFTPRVP